jgi:uncharacterized membrane protein
MTGQDITPTRLEAFSDGVIAIIITIMVLELKVPHDPTMAGLTAQWPMFLSYAISYLMVAIYWINHHHLFRHVHRVSTGILWANVLLLFSLSLIPFFTAYVGENHMATLPTVLYLGSLLACGLAFFILQAVIVFHLKTDPEIVGFGRPAMIKNAVALFLYTAGLVLAFYYAIFALLAAVIVGVMYIFPDASFKKKS